MIFKRPNKSFLSFFFLLILNPQLLFCGEKGKIEADDIVIKFDSYVSGYMKEHEAPGVAIAIVVDSRIPLIQGRV